MTDNSVDTAPSRSNFSTAIVRYGMPCALVTLSCLVIAGSFVVRAANRESRQAKQDLVDANSNSRRLLQQVYELANIYIDDIPNPTALSDREQRLLDAWVACDENFLLVNRENELILLERSLVARRAGTIRGLFGDFDRATKHLNESLTLLEQLGAEQSNQLDYQFLQIECYGLLAWTNANSKRYEQAVEACRTAADILAKVNLPDTSSSDLSFVKATHQVSHAALGLDEFDLAYRFGQAGYAARTRLAARSPGDPVAMEQLRQAKEFLELVKQRAGSLDAF